MELHLETLQNRIQKLIQTKYTPSQGSDQIADVLKLKEVNAKVRVIILSCISDSVFGRVKGLKEEKIVWEKLCLAYEGDLKTKQARLMNFKKKYEYLRMLEDESVEN